MGDESLGIKFWLISKVKSNQEWVLDTKIHPLAGGYTGVHIYLLPSNPWL